MDLWRTHKDKALEKKKIPVPYDRRTMIIVDMPGIQSVSEAFSYALLGWRPVPLYNGVASRGKMLVDAAEIADGLRMGTDRLSKLSIPPDAPPVFMLDSRRMHGSKAPGLFDNRWCVFPQDMPSASYLNSMGIEKVIVRTPVYVLEDLGQILFDYQKSGIALFELRNISDAPKAITARKPSLFKGFFYRLSVIAGLSRNSTGGFGSMVPYPRGHSIHRYHGLG